MENEQKESSKKFFALGEVFGYFFRKSDPNRKPDLNLKMMHGINKIAIIVFLLAILYFIAKKLFF
ncbi:MAG: hypothetical protein JXR07_02575 [Reichenbachiella sp.]